MISVDQARTIIKSTLLVRQTEDVPLKTAIGRMLARPVIARINQPPFAASAMDGYAVKHEQASRSGVKIHVSGLSAAGSRFQGALQDGYAVRIFTGAPVPEGADHIVIQEDTNRHGDEITILRDQPRKLNLRPLGCDFLSGQTLIPANVKLTGPMLALAAAGAQSYVTVRKRPKIALIANGDELVLPGEDRNADQIICSIPFALAPMIESWGGSVEFLGIARDNKADIRTLIENAMEHDLIVPIGGASVGDKDLMQSVFSDLAFDPVFSKVAVKPGKPVWFSKHRSVAAIGLPGNPASALVTATLFIKPAIEKMLGASATIDEVVRARLAGPLSANGPREAYLRSTLAVDNTGACIANPYSNQDSSLISIMASSQALVRRPANAPPANPGDVVDCMKI
jgi:molybdopterin molybdotransferase